MNIAQIVIEAKDNASETFRRVGDNVGGLQDKWGRLAGALALGGSVAWLTGLVNQSIQAADKLGDLEKVTGVAGSTLSRYTTLVATTGGDMDGFAKGLQKLSVGMVAADDKTETYQKTFGRLGITLRDTDGKMKGTEVMLNELADAFAGLEDGPEKTAMGVEIFGKSWKTIAPMLADGSAGLAEARQMAEDLGLALDEKTIAAAGRTADIFDVLKLGSQGLGNQIMTKFLPAIEGLAQMFLEGKRTGGILEGAIDGLLVVFKTVVSAGLIVVEVFRTLGTMVAGAAAAVMAAARGDFSGAMTAMNGAVTQVKTSNAAMDVTLTKLWNDTLPKVDEKTIKVTKSLGAKTTETDKNTAAVTRQKSAYEAMIEKMTRKSSELDAEILGTGKLTDGEKLLTQIKSGTLEKYKEYSAAQIDHITKLAEEQIKKERLIEQNKLVKKSIEDMAKEQAKLIETEQRAIESLSEQLAKQEQANAVLGLSKEALEALELAKFDDAIASLRQKIASEDNRTVSESLILAWGAQIEILGRLRASKESGNATAALIAQADAAKTAWENTAQSIGASLTGAIEGWVTSGQGLVTGLVSSIKRMFNDMVLRPVIQAVMNPIAGAMTNMFGSLGGIASNGAAQGGAGSMMGLLGAGAGMFGSGLTAGFGMLMQGGGALGLGGLGTAIGMGTGAMAGGSIAGGLGILGGALGPLALGAMLLSGLDNKGGGPKTEGSYSTGGGLYVRGTSGELDKEVRGGAEAMVAQYDSILRGLGMSGRGRADAAIFTAMDNGSGGDAQTQLQLAMAVNGRNVFNREALRGGMENVGRGSEALKEAIKEESLRAVVAALQATDLDSAANNYVRGLDAVNGAFDSLERSLTNLSTAGTMARQLEPLGGVFSRIATMGIEARAGLAEMTGGLEQFLAKTTSFVSNYFTEGERAALTARSITDTLQAAGLGTNVNTRADLRALIEDATLGPEQIAAILNIGESFAGLTAYLAANNITLSALASTAPTTNALQAVQDNAAAANDWARRQTEAAENTYTQAQAFVAGIQALTAEMEAANAAIAASSASAASSLTQLVQDGIETRAAP